MNVNWRTDDCPKVAGKPYLLKMEAGPVTDRFVYPIIAEWWEGTWIQWLSGDFYGLPVYDDQIVGWMEILDIEPRNLD